MNYPTENLEFFSQTIDEVRDRHQLIELRKALEAMKQFYNVARLLGHRELLSKIDINQVSTLLNVISRRLLNLSLMEKPDEFSSRTLLNLAMSDTTFSFVKIAEEELRLAANDLYELRKRVAGGINGRPEDKKTGAWLKDHGITRENFMQALSKVRNNRRITSDNPEETYDL